MQGKKRVFLNKFCVLFSTHCLDMHLEIQEGVCFLLFLLKGPTCCSVAAYQQVVLKGTKFVCPHPLLHNMDRKG